MPGPNLANGRRCSTESRIVLSVSHRIGLKSASLPDTDVGALVSLAQREAACCTFFSFAIEIQADLLVLAVEVPDDAVEILDQLVST